MGGGWGFVVRIFSSSLALHVSLDLSIISSCLSTHSPKIGESGRSRDRSHTSSTNVFFLFLPNAYVSRVQCRLARIARLHYTDFPIPVELGRAIIIVSPCYAHNDGRRFDFEILKTTDKQTRKIKSNNSLCHV